MSNPDFRSIETPWGTQFLHKSNIVWYAYYPLGSNNKFQKGYWQAYFTSSDYKGEKPWCHPNWCIGSNLGVATELEAIELCELRVVLYLEKQKRLI